ncbi:MAG: hypothetical protein ACPL28_05970 [bacterium]
MDTYYIFDRISPKLRNLITVLLFFTGYALQLSSRNILVGLPFIIFCMMLNLIKNFSLKPVRPMKLEWKEVTPERVEQVHNHCQRLSKIRGGALGCVIFMVIVFVLLFFGLPLLEVIGNALFSNISGSFPIITLIIDSLIVFGGALLSGRRSVWIPNNFDIKIPIIKRILNHPVFSKDPSMKIIPYLEIGETKEGQFPNDTRILIKFKDAPEDFIGLQFQISINNVQGRLYPYCYCVVIARPSFRLFEKFKSVEFSRITIETEKSSEADVIVIRQTTTKSSGYHTNNDAQDYILKTGIEIVKKILQAVI